jgi:hypothetical protein
LRGRKEKSNKTQTSLSLMDHEGTKSRSLPWREEDFAIFGGEERKGDGRRRKREKEDLVNSWKEKGKRL